MSGLRASLIALAFPGCVGDFSRCPAEYSTTRGAEGGDLDSTVEDPELDCEAWCGDWDRWEDGDCSECSQTCGESSSGDEVICRVSIPCE